MKLQTATYCLFMLILLILIIGIIISSAKLIISMGVYLIILIVLYTEFKRHLS